MLQQDAVHVHLEAGRQIFGIEIRRIATLTALGVGDQRYDAELFARQVDWLTCMINSSDERITFDLRIVTTPWPELYTNGRVKLGLLCAIEDTSLESARGRSIELVRLCESFFDDEYEFAPITRPDDLLALLSPFGIGALAEITRRAD